MFNSVGAPEIISRDGGVEKFTGCAEEFLLFADSSS